MKFNEVKELIELINHSELSYFEMQDEKDYIKIDKSMSRNYTSNNGEFIESKTLNKLALTDIRENLDLQKNNIVNEEMSLHNENIVAENANEDFDYIKSPIVGTYYEATSPESDPFVSVGQKVSKGEVICIIEAMKLMNEISAEYDCEIVSVLGENSKIVEYGQDLFKVRRV
ncbi:MAG: acetyl-CoA carboxylase biotin carboxyl carrier protein [Peptostreptococcaceae bacterium]